jgi:hypothetical protein|tara:strand:- start:252 stop:362 length:111 start_codon:yes stop_codon:yes gene_type:complete
VGIKITGFILLLWQFFATKGKKYWLEQASLDLAFKN